MAALRRQSGRFLTAPFRIVSENGGRRYLARRPSDMVTAKRGDRDDPGMEWMHRSCPICEAQCGLRLHVDRANRVVERIEGDPEDPRSRGFLCPKALALT